MDPDRDKRLSLPLLRLPLLLPSIDALHEVSPLCLCLDTEQPFLFLPETFYPLPSSSEVFTSASFNVRVVSRLSQAIFAHSQSFEKLFPRRKRTAENNMRGE
ncbi:hypothetical protein LshimejAT787_0303470 [Lyophyllum shimeji]|uniref:Uncharacterized protein n=1 Tax=Lyophyllum shimeji TaxID=47721 RepID=A0A9P3PII7_LYOSH|nr:hypothetical protein LshimejAT787_0303470 [Lyophyllum shimeji]